ncbi:hypothetical protein PL371_16680 [Tenacibaculum maritimum]|nr:hypothetical protein [Tenacibaculum maritimum]MDB0613468.1 hypothetical protein [Tenacibaculum maritimum]
MLGSKNDFFVQSEDFLLKAKGDMISVLQKLGRSKKDIDEYLEAFEYFCIPENQNKYDGSTVLRDLYLLRYRNPNVRLSVDSMKHDYDYLMGANRNWKKQWKADLKYFFGLLSNGKGTHYTRLIALLLLSTTLLIPINFIKSKLK